MTYNRQLPTNAVSFFKGVDSIDVQPSSNTRTATVAKRSIVVTLCLEKTGFVSEAEVLSSMLEHQPD